MLESHYSRQLHSGRTIPKYQISQYRSKTEVQDHERIEIEELIKFLTWFEATDGWSPADYQKFLSFNSLSSAIGFTKKAHRSIRLTKANLAQQFRRLETAGEES